MKCGSAGAPLLHQVDKGGFSGGICSTMHITSRQAAVMRNFEHVTSLVYVYTRGKGVDIVNKINTRSRKVIRIANFNQISILKKRKHWR
jgi:hypothetical protein